MILGIREDGPSIFTATRQTDTPPERRTSWRYSHYVHVPCRQRAAMKLDPQRVTYLSRRGRTKHRRGWGLGSKTWFNLYHRLLFVSHALAVRGATGDHDIAAVLSYIRVTTSSTLELFSTAKKL